MANFHSDEWIMEKLNEHYQDALKHFPERQILGIFLQGSQNYELDIENSDIDTKLIVPPSLKEIAANSQAVSTTFVRENNEHIDFKDIRKYIETFRKQNLNFLEILFTKYKIVNPLYAKEWARLETAAEEITRMNPYRSVQSMKGVAMEKYHAMEHRYESKIDILDKYGYDPKQLHHLARVYDFLVRYIKGEQYKNCLIPEFADELIAIKLGKYDLVDAREIANDLIIAIHDMCDEFYAKTPKEENQETLALLQEVQYNIIKKSLTIEILEATGSELFENYKEFDNLQSFRLFKATKDILKGMGGYND